MTLLQIAEPGKSAAPHQHRRAVGIDLGTTNSLVAAVRSGVSQVIEDEDGRALLPSIVRYLADGTTEVGHAAQAQQSEDPHNTIVSVKRFMGRGLEDLPDAGRLPYRFSETPGMVRSKPPPAPERRWKSPPTSSSVAVARRARSAASS